MSSSARARARLKAGFKAPNTFCLGSVQVYKSLAIFTNSGILSQKYLAHLGTLKHDSLVYVWDLKDGSNPTLRQSAVAPLQLAAEIGSLLQSWAFLADIL